MKLFKIIFSFIGIMILFAVVAAILLMTFVSPNRFKPIITQEVKKSTGRELVIDGDLSWSFYPNVGVKVGHMTLSNPPEFKQPLFAEIDHATVNVVLFSLLHGKVESQGMTLSGMKLYLIKNAKGRTNWQDLQQASAAPIKPKEKLSHEEIDTQSAFRLAISAVTVSNATINWIDEAAKNNFTIQGFELHAKDINTTMPFPISTSFNFISTHPALSGTVALQSDVSLNNQIFSFKKTSLSSRINNVDLNIQGDIIANLAKETLQFDDFRSQMNSLTANGRMTVSNFMTAPEMKGHVQINPVDFKAWLQAIGQKTDDLQEMKDLSGDLDFTVRAPSMVSAQGRFKLDSLQTSKIKITDANVEMRFKDNVLQFAPLTAKLYKGDLYSQVKVDLNGVAPQYTLQATISNVQAEPLVHDLSNGKDDKIKFSGTGNVDLQVTSSGIDSATVVRNLNGSGNLKFEDGTLTGVDIGYLIDSAYALAKHQQSNTTDTNKTNFGSMTGTVTIHDGVIENNDLRIEATRFNTTGKGKINLVNQDIDYSLQTFAKKASESDKDNAANLYGMSIPIRISGNLNSPAVRLDTDEILKQVAQKQVEKIRTNAQDKIKEQLNQKAGELLNNFMGN